MTPSHKSLLPTLYNNITKDMLSYAYKSITAIAFWLYGSTFSEIIPNQVFENSQTPDTIMNLHIIIWHWGIIICLATSVACGYLLHRKAKSLFGVPHSEIPRLRRYYFALHMLSMIFVAILLGWLVAFWMTGTPFSNKGFLFVIAFVAVSYSILYVTLSTLFLPRYLRVAATYNIVRRPLIGIGY